MIKNSRSKDNGYLWRFESTSSKTFKDEKKSDKENDKITTGRMCDTMLEHPAQQWVFKRDRKPDETDNHLLGCQVSQMKASMHGPHNKFESKKLKGTCVTGVSEKLLPRK